MKESVRRGDVYWCDMDVFKNVLHIKHIESGIRPVIIMSNDKNNKYCSHVQVVPVTSRRDSLPQHKEIHIGQTKCYTVPESMVTISKTNLLGKLENRVTNKDMTQVELSIKVQLGLIS